MLTGVVGWLLAGGAALSWPTRQQPGRHRGRAEVDEGVVPARVLPMVVTVSVVGLVWVAVGAAPAAVIAVPAAVLATRAGPRVFGVARRPQATTDLPLTLNLVAAALRAGHPVAIALDLGARGSPGSPLSAVAKLLRLGAEPDEAWRPFEDDDALTPLALAARRSSASGIRLAAAFDQVAEHLRGLRRQSAQARAARVGVLAMAPLGLCFLPGFVCLGIVPTVGGLLRSAWGGVGL